MYICTPSVCFKQASTRPHPCASKCRRTGRCGRDRARTPARADTATWLPLVSETGPSVIQVKSSECACIFKNKIHLQKRSFSSIPPPAVGSPSQAVRVAPGLVPLRVFPVAFPKETPSSRDQAVREACMLQSPVCRPQCSDMRASEGPVASVRRGGNSHDT